MCQIRSGLWIEKVSICTNTSLSAADPRSEPGLATMYKTGPFLYMDGRGKPGGKHRANVTRGRGGELTFGERSRRVAVRDRTTVTPPRHPPRPLV
jgi:hypothetical protein